MGEFHYVRTLGVDGGVDACEGPAIGLDLETVLADGLPPWNIAVEIIAAMCEILDISTEDNEIHGDLHPKYVFIDETGAVSIEGFGVPRSRTSAPEGTPRGGATDLYGLGRISFACVSPSALQVDALSNDDPDAHDDRVIDAVLDLDLSGLPEGMQGDVQWFLAKLVSFDREDRPPAVDAWRTFIAFASEMTGPDMSEWCAAALDGGGARRTAVESAPASSADEELGGPVKAKLAMAHEVNFDAGGSVKGGATAFWTKADMKRALERDQAADEEGPPMGAGGGSATNFWSRDQLAAMAKGEAEAPRPKRNKGEGTRRRETKATVNPRGDRPRPGVENRTAPPPQMGTGFEPADDLPTDPVAARRPTPAGAGRVEPELRTAPVPELDLEPSEKIPVRAPAQAPPAPRPPAARPPEREVVIPPPEWAAAEEPEAGGGIRLALLGGSGCAVGGVALLVVGVLALVVIAVVLNAQTPTTSTPSPVPLPGSEVPADVQPPLPGSDPVPSPEPSPEPAPGATPKPGPSPSPQPAPKPSPKPNPQPASPKPTPTPTPKPTPTPTPKPTPKPKPPPAPAATDDARVSVRTSGRGKVLVCMEQAKAFDGPFTFSIEKWRLPANCLVQIDGAKGILNVSGSGTTTCDRQGTAVVCSPASLP